MRATTQRGHHRVRAALALVVLLGSFLVVGASATGAAAQGSSSDPKLPVCGSSESGAAGVRTSADCLPPPPPPPPPPLLPVQAPGVPSVATSETCIAGNGSITLTLANTAASGAKDVVFVVTDPVAKTDGTFNLAAGATKDVVFGDLADRTYAVDVVADGVDVSPTSIEVNCSGVARVSDPTQSCTQDGGKVEITLGNSAGEGARAVTYRVTDPVTKAEIEYKVVPGATRVVTFIGLDPGTYKVVITADGVPQTIGDAVVACEVPFANVGSLECAAGGINVNFENNGESPTTEALFKNGVLLTTVEVPAKGSEIALVPMTEGETATVTVKSGATTLAEKSVTDDCGTVGVIAPTDPTPAPDSGDAQVLAATQTRTATGTLPRTGADSGRLVLVGLTLVLLGVGLVAVTRRRRLTDVA